MKQATRETVHTVIQVILGAAPAVPLFITGNEFAGAGTLLAVSAAITRLMALDSVQLLLAKFGLNTR